uniref:Uncharacterized protein n=1 Tax=Oryza nivara TaxID=4536 RepID=A0A0E0FP28_ORYNI
MKSIKESSNQEVRKMEAPLEKPLLFLKKKRKQSRNPHNEVNM